MLDYEALEKSFDQPHVFHTSDNRSIADSFGEHTTISVT